MDGHDLDARYSFDEDELYEDSLYEDQEYPWECAFPGECCMGFTDHMRDECYTVEMAQEYEDECIRENPTREYKLGYADALRQSEGKREL